METSSATTQKKAKYSFETLNLKFQSYKQLKLVLSYHTWIYTTKEKTYFQSLKYRTVTNSYYQLVTILKCICIN